jgi:hypothetical protein
MQLMSNVEHHERIERSGCTERLRPGCHSAPRLAAIRFSGPWLRRAASGPGGLAGSEGRRVTRRPRWAQQGRSRRVCVASACSAGSWSVSGWRFAPLEESAVGRRHAGRRRVPECSKSEVHRPRECKGVAPGKVGGRAKRDAQLFHREDVARQAGRRRQTLGIGGEALATITTFEKALMKALGIHILPKLHQDKGALNEVIANEVIGVEGPRYVHSDYTQLEFDLWRIYKGHAEVQRSIGALEDIAFYIGQFPYQGTAVPASRYLRFHAEAHLSEIYILRERMTTLAKIVKRQLKRLQPPKLGPEDLDSAISLVEKTLEPVVRTRGRHTHEQRLTDPEIDRMDTVALFAQFPDGGISDVARNYVKRAEREAFQKRRRIVRDNNRAISKLRRPYEKVLHQAIFFRGSPFLRAADA